MTEHPDADRLDRHGRTAARAFRDDVADTVDLAAAHPASAPTRGPGGLVVISLVVIALLAAGVWLYDDGDVEVAVDETTTTTTTAPSVPDVDAPATGLALGAPDDGKDSVGLPVDADPKTGLLDGQTVTVVGAQFPPNSQVGVVMCAKEAGRDHGGRGADACNLGHVAYADSDAQGNVTVAFQVLRLITLDGQEIDCASEAGRCLIGMGLISDYDQSGGVLVDFDPSAPLPDPPTIELSKTAELADGESVRVRVTGLMARTTGFADVCAGSSCVPLRTDLVADEQGTIEAEVSLWRTFGGWDEASGMPTNIDCTITPCRFTLYGEAPGGRTVPPVDLSFSTSGTSRVPPTMRILDEGPFAPGDRIRVELTGLAGTDFVDVQSCVPGRDCIASGGAAITGGDSVVVPVEVHGTCAADCFLWATPYHEGSGPPPLYPEPVPFVVTG